MWPARLEAIDVLPRLGLTDRSWEMCACVQRSLCGDHMIVSNQSMALIASHWWILQVLWFVGQFILSLTTSFLLLVSRCFCQFFCCWHQLLVNTHSHTRCLSTMDSISLKQVPGLLSISPSTFCCFPFRGVCASPLSARPVRYGSHSRVLHVLHATPLVMPNEIDARR